MKFKINVLVTVFFLPVIFLLATQCRNEFYDNHGGITGANYGAIWNSVNSGILLSNNWAGTVNKGNQMVVGNHNQSGSFCGHQRSWPQLVGNY